LEGAAGVKQLEEAADVERAEAALQAHPPPDLVLLDVQMPRRDGVGVVEAVGVEAMPLTVFVTAYDQHALAAFEAQALDYLLKPFAPQRFRRVLERARRRLEEEDAARLARRFESLLASGSRRRYLKRLEARLGEGREVLLPVAEIEWIEARGNYLHLFSSRGECVRRGTLKDLLEQLDPEEFLPVNRSQIVRLDAVTELHPLFHGDYRVQLESGRTLTWSRRYRARWKMDSEGTSG
ncbi:MAG: response regulator transcription factor, partial [Acidobacteria bacterium]|nr:response regulator transcription factor [Acidobacteriota bacterium]